MASEIKINIVPLKGSNYSTWKVQCRMALMRDGLWGIVDGMEAEPLQTSRNSLFYVV